MTVLRKGLRGSVFITKELDYVLNKHVEVIMNNDKFVNKLTEMK